MYRHRPVQFRPIGFVRVGLIDGEFVAEPTAEQMNESTLDLLYSGTKNTTLMIEVAAQTLHPNVVKNAILFAHSHMSSMIDAQNVLRDLNGYPKRGTPYTQGDDARLLSDMREAAARLDGGEGRAIFEDIRKTRKDRAFAEATFQARLSESLAESFPTASPTLIQFVAHERLWKGIRTAVMNGVRCDGRSFDQVRQLQAHLNLLPAVHGSGMFARGNTKVMCAATLGPLFEGMQPTMQSNTAKALEQYKQHNNVSRVVQKTNVLRMLTWP